MKLINLFKYLVALMALPLVVGMVGCSKNIEGGIRQKPTIVASFYPQYAWIKEILGSRGDSMNVVLLVKNGMDLHSYQPSAEDIATIAQSDVVVYIGGPSDGWIQKALTATSKQGRIGVNLMESLGEQVKAEELVEGMEHEESEEHHGDNHEEYDEHVWLSLKNAEIFVNKLAQVLSDLDKDHAEEYKTNALAYIAKIKALDGDFRQMVESASNKTILVGDRFPFRYLVDDYGVKYYAAFVGCSAESEAGFETVAFLAHKMDSLQLPAIYIIDGGNRKIADAILGASKNSKKVPVLILNSMQSAAAQNIKSGDDYLGAMQGNLEMLKKVLR